MQYSKLTVFLKNLAHKYLFIIDDFLRPIVFKKYQRLTVANPEKLIDEIANPSEHETSICKNLYTHYTKKPKPSNTNIINLYSTFHDKMNVETHSEQQLRSTNLSYNKANISTSEQDQS